MVFFDDVPSCLHNNMVECPENRRNCKKCGWSPEVSLARFQAFVESHPEFTDELERMGKLPRRHD